MTFGELFKGHYVVKIKLVCCNVFNVPKITAEFEERHLEALMDLTPHLSAKKIEANFSFLIENKGQVAQRSVRWDVIMEVTSLTHD